MTTNAIDLQQELSDIQRNTDESLKILVAHGFVLDLTEWLTIKRYAEKYGQTQQVVVNWINRGVIPAESVKELPELNNMRLVKDQVYK